MLNPKSTYVYEGELFPEMVGGTVQLMDIAACSGISERVIRNRVRARRSAKARGVDVGSPIVNKGSLVITDGDLKAITRGPGVRKDHQEIDTESNSILWRGEENWSTSPLLSKHFTGWSGNKL